VLNRRAMTTFSALVRWQARAVNSSISFEAA
jgi:hypothetical protein